MPDSTPPRTPDPVPAWLRTALLICLATLAAHASAAASHKPHAPKAASSPSTAQILAPSTATVPDDLPPERQAYRCGSSYSSRPCPDAAAMPLHIDDARSQAQLRQSTELTARDKRLAAWYEAGRREREPAASAPTPGRRAAAGTVCTDTAMMTCVPKRPRARKLLSSGASGPAMAARGGN